MSRLKYFPLLFLVLLSITYGICPDDIFDQEPFRSSTHANSLDATANQPYAMVRRAVALANNGHAVSAVALLQKIIARWPAYLPAHVQYVGIRTFYQQSYESVRKEYDALMSHQPNNPVYPLALAFGARGLIPERVRRAWLEKMSQATPESAWGHYARAELTKEHDAEAAARELSLCLDGDGTMPQPYLALISLEMNKLHRPQDAMATAQRMASQPETHIGGQYQLWKLRLAGAGEDQQRKADVRAEADSLAASSADTEMLTMLRNAYSDLLSDQDRIANVERKLRELDPGWYPEKSAVFLFVQADGDGIPQQVAMCCKSVTQLFKIYFVPDSLDPNEQISRLEKLLELKPNPTVKQYIYERLLDAAEKSGDHFRRVQYAEAVHSLDPNGIVWLAKLALALADTKRELDKALRYARLARAKTAHPFPAVRAQNSDADWFNDTVTTKWQKTNFDEKRALALDAYGWVLCRRGDPKGAEASLQESIRISRSESKLRHLAEALRGVGRTQEADDLAQQAQQERVNAIKQKMLKEPAPQFELTTLSGSKIRLSDLKGRVVLLYFFTTWCTSCSKEKSYLPGLLQTFPDKDFALLAVSLDQESDRNKLELFAKELGENVQLVVGEHMAQPYKVSSPPGIVVIDRTGDVRYRELGFTVNTPGDIDVVVRELMK